jgi:hypothetical protein
MLPLHPGLLILVQPDSLLFPPSYRDSLHIGNVYAMERVGIAEWWELHSIADSGANLIGRLHRNRLDEVDGPHALGPLVVVAGELVG